MLDPWYIAGIVSFIVLSLICVVIIILNIYWAKESGYDIGGNITGGVASFLSLLSIIACAVFTPLGFYPYDVQYKSWNERSGTVVQISDRLLASGDGMEQKFVVVFEGDDQPYGCEDTRCALLEEGDFLELSCIRVWQFAGSHGFDCAFVDLKKAS